MSPAKPEPGRIGPSNVAHAFDEHARSYDRLVGANRTYHEHLRMTTRRMGLRDHGAGLRLLDLGCGTGASTQALLDAAPEAEITAVDASYEMLSIARAKNWPPGVRFVHGSVDELDRLGVNGFYDGILAAYLLRNLAEPNAALRTFHALLRPGAPLAVHEYSVADSTRAKIIWAAVCWGVIIPMGRLRSGSADLYRYLWRSVLDFDGVEALTTRMHATGFVDVRHQTFPGWQQQIVHTFLGRRAPDPVTPPFGLNLSKITPPEPSTEPPPDGESGISPR